MNGENTMSKMPQTTKHDWSRLDAMSDEERHAAALSDPDAQPMTEEDFRRMKRTPQVQNHAPRSSSMRRRNLRRGFIFRSVRCMIGSKAAKSLTPPPVPICG